MTTDGSKFVKRRFSLPAELDKHLVKSADEFYNGNKSRFLRSAIQDHTRTLKEEDEFAIKALNSQINELSSDIEEVKGLMDNINKSLKTNSQLPEGSTADTSESNSLDLVNAKRQVQSEILDAEGTSLSLSALCERLELDSLIVQKAVSGLIENAVLEKNTTNDEIEFQIMV